MYICVVYVYTNTYVYTYLYIYTYIAHSYVCTHVYKIGIYWHWVTLSELHEECKPPISLAKGFFLGSVLRSLTIFLRLWDTIVRYLSLGLLGKTSGNHLHRAESPSDMSKSTAPFCFRSGPGAWRQRQFWSPWGTWSDPRAANHGQCLTSAQPPTHPSSDSPHAKEGMWVIQPNSPPLCHHLKDAWEVSGADSTHTGCILSTSVESRYSWSRKPATFVHFCCYLRSSSAGNSNQHPP